MQCTLLFRHGILLVYVNVARVAARPANYTAKAPAPEPTLLPTAGDSPKGVRELLEAVAAAVLIRIDGRMDDGVAVD